MGFDIEGRKLNNPWQQAEDFFDQRLKLLGLSKEQIEAYSSVEELHDALQRVNDCIKNIDQFAKFSISAEMGLIASSAKSTAEFGALPILLERKKLITDRIRILTQGKQIDNLKDLISEIPEEFQPKVSSSLEQIISEFQKQNKEKDEIDKQVREAEIEAIRKREEFEREITRLKERSKVWLSFLARESVASIVGAVLLIIITIAQLIAMHPNVETTEILNNSFLVILGYFFGQAVNKTAKQDKEE